MWLSKWIFKAVKYQSKRKIDGFVAFLCAHKETMDQMIDVNEDDMDEYLDSIYR